MRTFEDLQTGMMLSTENELSAELMAENAERYREVTGAEKGKSTGKGKGAGKGKGTGTTDSETPDTGSGE